MLTQVNRRFDALRKPYAKQDKPYAKQELWWRRNPGEAIRPAAVGSASNR